MYWANNGTGTVHRANLDGTDIELLHSGLSSVGDLTLDLVGGKIYWAETSAGMIQRKNLDGSGAVENIITGANEPYYLALDRAADRVYWSELGDSGVDSAIRRAPIVGDGLEEIFVSALERPRGVQLDLVGGMVYWAERGAAPAIKRRNIDRSGVTETLFDAGDGLIRPHGVALDLEGGMIYWTDTTTASIQRGALDGTGSVEPLVPGLVGPWDIVAVPEPSTWTLLAVAALLLGACGPLRRRVFRTR